jgi:hypothetical protein
VDLSLGLDGALSQWQAEAEAEALMRGRYPMLPQEPSSGRFPHLKVTAIREALPLKTQGELTVCESHRWTSELRVSPWWRTVSLDSKFRLFDLRDTGVKNP